MSSGVPRELSLTALFLGIFALALALSFVLTRSVRNLAMAKGWMSPPAGLELIAAAVHGPSTLIVSRASIFIAGGTSALSGVCATSPEIEAACVWEGTRKHAERYPGGLH